MTETESRIADLNTRIADQATIVSAARIELDSQEERLDELIRKRCELVEQHFNDG